MKRSTVWAVILLSLGVASGAFLWLTRAGNEAPTDVPPVKRYSVKLPTEYEVPAPNAFDPTLHSAWIDNEKKRFSSLLAAQPCDTLVVPAQGKNLSFDRATRSLMTAQIAELLGREAGRCVVDPYLAARALGEGLQQFTESETHKLAESVQAKTIVSAYIGHDGHMKMDVVLRIEAANDASAHSYKMGSSKDWHAIEFSDEKPPFVVWRDKLPTMLAEVGFRNLPQAPSPQQPAELAIPDSPVQLAEQPSRGAFDDAQRFALLGLLAPQPDFRPTERFFEKSWLAASNAADTAESRRVRARALYHLNYRPAALALLDGDDSAEARVLRELLNGNLFEAQKAQEGVKAPLDLLAGAMEIVDVSQAYSREHVDQLPGPLQEVAGRAPAWHMFLDARAGDMDEWHSASNLPLKVLLDKSYAIDGFSLQDFSRANASVGKAPDDPEMQLLAIRHINRLLDKSPGRACCASFKAQPQALDFLDLTGARAQANIEKFIEHMLFAQGLPDRALELLDKYDAEFPGNPHFSLLRANVNAHLLQAHPNERVAERTQAMHSAARITAFWEQGMNSYTRRALVSVGVPSQDSLPFMSYSKDFPPKSAWYFGDMQRALPYATTDLSMFERLTVGANDELRKQLLAALAGRFHGSPQLASVREHVSGQKSGIDELRAAIAQDPANWEPYSRLARRLVLDGDYDGAASLTEQYPGFKPDSGENSVGLSNNANEVGSQLYWHGAIDASARLYKLAAKYDNGSDASMVATERLRLLDGDYAGAAQAALQRISRYDGVYAYRDYLSMLFAMGFSKDAWPTFLKVADHFDDQELWPAAIFGQRIAGDSAQQVLEWAARDTIRGVRINYQLPALWLALQSFMIDRKPPADLAAQLARIEGPPQARLDGNDYVTSPLPNGQGFQPAYRGKFRMDKQTMKDGDSVPSPYVLVAEAYVDLRRGDHDAATAAFAHVASLYQIEGNWDFALPYFAFSAAKSGDKLGLRKFLQALPEDNKQFAFHLSEAFFSGIAGRHDEAVENLQQAFRKRNARYDEIFTAYQFAEACIWLFEETHEPRYRDMAIDWARKYQKLNPTGAWPYALEAKYAGAKAKGHLRAVALALYLDRNSEWLKAVPKADIEEARTWLKTNNPFLKQPAKGSAI